MWLGNKHKIKSLPLGANLSMSPARKEISSSERALKSYSALPTTWSSSPLAQLLDPVFKHKSQVYLLWVTKFGLFFKGKWRKHFNFLAKTSPIEKWHEKQDLLSKSNQQFSHPTQTATPNRKEPEIERNDDSGITESLSMKPHPNSATGRLSLASHA